jgi:putative aldouronate transport system substrate-binding protein
MFARFITGDADIDTEWDDYLKELENMRLPRYLELMQQSYDKKYK